MKLKFWTETIIALCAIGTLGYWLAVKLVELLTWGVACLTN